VTIIQLTYYWLLFARLAFYKLKKQPSEATTIPVSVIIVARNEYYNLKDFLPAVLDQDYPDFEVVIVNHASDDDTDLLLKEFGSKYKNLKVVEIKEDLNFFKGKKFPLSIGIREAKNEILLLTDADCKPASRYWIKNMVYNYISDTTQVVLGYSPYIKKKGFTNILVRYDTFMVALNYLSFAIAGKPYMGVGRNLSYQKKLFFKQKGFISHYNIPSGDDDLFISQVAKKDNTKVELHPDSFVYSIPKNSLKEWFKQKKRHVKTSSKYKSNIKFLLGFFSFTQVLFYLLLITTLFYGINPLIVFGIFSTRLLSQIIIHKKAGIMLDEKNICIFSLIWEFFHLILMIFIITASKFSKNKSW
jgi:glycosyltransferase involved in cell wall biosynthesis